MKHAIISYSVPILHCIEYRIAHCRCVECVAGKEINTEIGQPGVGFPTRDFERWLKGPLEVEHFSLLDLFERKGSLAGDPGR
jgi:hypothetical protein